MLERLVLQHEAGWLKILAEACSGQKLDDLVNTWGELKLLIQATKASNNDPSPFSNNKILDQLFWKQVFRKVVIQNNSIPSAPQWLAGFLQTIFPPLTLVPLLSAWKQQLELKDKPYQLISRVIDHLVGKFSNTPENKSEKLKKRNAEKENIRAEKKSNDPDKGDEGSETVKISDWEKSGNSLGNPKEDTQHKVEPATHRDKDASENSAKRSKEFDQQGKESATEIENSEPKREKKPDKKKQDSPESKDTINPEEHQTADRSEVGEGKQTDLLHIDPSPPEREPFMDIQKVKIPSNKEYPAGTEFYIKEAGMVLLHPFLSTFYQTCGLLEEKKFKDEAARQRAVLLLQYLATGETELPEYKLLLPKLLCDMPLELPVEKHLDLSELEANEGENMLKAVIKHWGALGNSSPGALQEGFLLRDGKLSKRPNGWYLQVEQKSIDILLDRLPWNLSMIKLPWMKDLLKVEWV